MFGPADKKLGFGFMRLPMKGEEVDIETTCRMVDEFLAAGFCYFDTAHGYHDGQSEAALKAALTSRYPREKYILADRLSPPFFETEADIRPLFEQQLEACGVEYFDMYLMHAQSAGRFEFYKSCRAYETAFALKAEGRVRHVGISFHDTAEVLERILTEYPQLDFVQLQFNYLDYEDPQVQSRACYEVCRRHQKPVVVMEPVRGGRLAQLPDEARALLAKVSDSSPAGFALRFAADFEGVKMVLSGMSTMEQVHDNIACMQSFAGFGREEEQAIEKAQEALARIPVIPCTSCNYCAEVCPGDIGISGSFTAMNYLTMYGNMAAARHQENWLVTMHQRKRADECLQCGACEEVCPQHIHIRDELKRVCATFGINGEG